MVQRSVIRSISLSTSMAQLVREQKLAKEWNRCREGSWWLSMSGLVPSVLVQARLGSR